MHTTARLRVLIAPPLIILLLTMLVPLVGMMIFSVRADSFDADAGFSLAAYTEFFTDGRYLRLMGSTTVTAFWVSLFSVAFAYPVAYFIAFKAGRWKIPLIALIIVPAWTSYLLRILSWKIILGSNGLLYSLLESLNISLDNFPLLLYSPSAVIITLVYVWIPFAALPIFVTIDRIERNLLEAAADLGANRWTTFWRITFPLSFPGVIASFLYVFIPTFGDWVTPTLVGGAQGGILYGNIIHSQYTRALNWAMGSVLSLALLAVVGIILFGYSALTRWRAR